MTTFAALEVFAHAAEIPSFRGGTLLRPQQPGAAFVVLARWDDPSGYQAWLDAPIRARLGERLDPFVVGEMAGRLYDEIEQ